MLCIRLLRSGLDCFKAVLCSTALLIAGQAFAVSNTYAIAPDTGPVVPEVLQIPAGSSAASRVELAADGALEQEIVALKRANSDPDSGLKILQIGVGREVPRIPEATSAFLRWERVEGGVAAQWRVSSQGARALRIGLGASFLPSGTEIRFAGEDGAGVVYGPFGAAEIFAMGPIYWSPVLEGENAIVEVFVAEGSPHAEVVLSISRVSHLFASLRDADLETAVKVGESGPCEVDLICRSASDPALAAAGKAVARMAFTSSVGGTGYCTGTLLNPIVGPLTPYFYSANHCISTQSAASTLTTHWFYDRAVCGSGSPGYTQLTGGATLLYNNATSDVLLLRLNNAAPSGAVYTGWDSTAVTNGTPIVAIHHPATDVKKVSLGTIGGFSAYGMEIGTGSSHIVALWNGLSTGVTEGGSSGSGIFTAVGSPPSEYRLRGGLHGGPSHCAASGSALRDYYSRFDQAYPSMAQYLNPGTTTYALTVAKAGSGSGTVVSSPAGINCGTTCSATFNTGAGVTLTATALSGSTFSGWSGAGCSGGGQCSVTMNAAAMVTATFTISSVSNPPRLANISTRMQVLTGDNVLTGGFIIGGSAPKTVVVRARGPSLALMGVPGTLANPVLNLYSGQTVIASNDDWQSASNASTLQASGFAPADAQESAIYTTLNPGPYTAIVSGAAGTTGIGIVEVFEVDAYTTPLINIATRGAVQTGDNVMIGGFIIQGSGPQTVVVRARGPSLAAAGVPNVLMNPVLNLYSGQTVIASNDDWEMAANAAALQASGFAPANGLESAILVTLNPGAYTAIVSGYGGSTGVGIVEVFAVP